MLSNLFILDLLKWRAEYWFYGRVEYETHRTALWYWKDYSCVRLLVWDNINCQYNLCRSFAYKNQYDVWLISPSLLFLYPYFYVYSTYPCTRFKGSLILSMTLPWYPLHYTTVRTSMCVLLSISQCVCNLLIYSHADRIARIIHTPV